MALATYIGFIFLIGMLSDRLGRKKVLMSASILFVVLTVPAFMLLETGNFLVILLVQILLGAMLSLNDGTLPSYLAEMFPTRVRYSGFAVSFNLSNALFGGTAPFVATAPDCNLRQRTGPGLVPHGCGGHLPDCCRLLGGNQQETTGLGPPQSFFPHTNTKHKQHRRTS